MKRQPFFYILTAGLLYALPAKAVCPVCVIAVGAGLGLSRWLGIDDTITGVWLGGLLVALTIWTNNWLAKKGWTFYGFRTIIAIAFYLLTFAPLYWQGIVGHPQNVIWGIDKLIAGVAIGTIVFYASHQLYEYLKKKNNDHAWFPFQKIAMPVFFLTLASFIFYFLTK